MADPKYDKLYGIARDQPDVYETSDLPEADQPGEIYEEKSDAVERLHISAPEAFSKFRGKQLDVGAVDFSDHIGRKRTHGYNVRANSWELAGFGEQETPAQKYNRLKLEIEHLVEELSDFSKNTEEDLSRVSDTLGVSVENARDLLLKCTDFKLENKIGIDFDSSTQQIGEPQFEKLLSHIDNLGKELDEKSVQSKEKSEVSQTDRNTVQFVLNLKPSQRIQLMSRITNLEQKLKKLEIIVGSNNSHVVRFCNVNADDGLINCCQWMIAKLSLLDSSQLDQIESKVNNVNSRLEQLVNSQNSLTQDPEKEKKINELYELSNMAKEKSELIPMVIDRMAAIETMHKQGKQSVQTISHLEALQSELAASLTNNNTALRNIQENLNSNLAVIKNDVQSLKTRIEALMAAKK